MTAAPGSPRLRPGTRALIEGPYGKLTGETYTGGPVLMLACGIGVTPLLALLGELPYRPGEATLVYRARSEAEVAFRARNRLAGHAPRRARRLPARPAAQPALVAARVGRRPQRRGRAAPDRSPDRSVARFTSAVRMHGPRQCATPRTHRACAGERLHTEQFAW